MASSWRPLQGEGCLCAVLFVILSWSDVPFVVAACGSHGSSAMEQRAIRELVKHLSGPSIEERCLAAEKLGDLGTSAISAIPALLRVAKQDLDPTVRRYAINALGRIGGDPGSVVPVLAKILVEAREEDETRRAAAIALGLMGKPALVPLTDALESKDLLVRRSAAYAIVIMSEDARSILTKLALRLCDSDSEVRSSVALVLGRMGRVITPVVSPYLKHENPWTRLVAAEAILRTEPFHSDRQEWPMVGQAHKDQGKGSLSAEGREALRVVCDTLRIRNSDLRVDAVSVMSDLGTYAKPAIRNLILVLADESARVRVHAIDALVHVCPNSTGSVTAAIASRLTDSESEVRVAAARALARVGPGAHRAVSALIGALEDAEVEVRVAAANALGEMGHHALAAVPALMRLRNTIEYDEYRETISTAIRRIQGNEKE